LFMNFSKPVATAFAIYIVLPFYNGMRGKGRHLYCRQKSNKKAAF
jgi:hypothetical protein